MFQNVCAPNPIEMSYYRMDLGERRNFFSSLERNWKKNRQVHAARSLAEDFRYYFIHSYGCRNGVCMTMVRFVELRDDIVMSHGPELH